MPERRPLCRPCFADSAPCRLLRLEERRLACYVSPELCGDTPATTAVAVVSDRRIGGRDGARPSAARRIARRAESNGMA